MDEIESSPLKSLVLAANVLEGLEVRSSIDDAELLDMLKHLSNLRRLTLKDSILLLTGGDSEDGSRKVPNWEHLILRLTEVCPDFSWCDNT